jgi:chemotaxis regulatin CheY-phosphate phosphatase CheZ
MTTRNVTAMTPEERAAKVEALKPAWAKDYILQLESLTRTLHAQLTEAKRQDAADLELAREISGARDRVAAQVIPGIAPPSGEYATARVLDGRANMEPVADLAEGAEVLFAGFYQVHYGDHETTAGARVLVIEGSNSLIVRPVSQTTVIIARG